MKDNHKFLFIKLRANGVNLGPVDYIYGNIGLPAIYGFSQLLQRYLAQGECKSEIGGFNVSVYSQQINTVNNRGVIRFTQSRNPHYIAGANLNGGTPIIEECKGRGTYGLVFKIYNHDDKTLDVVRNRLYSMRFSGGTIEEVFSISMYDCDKEGERSLLKRLLPGAILIDRHKMLVDYCKENKADPLDALLDHLSLTKMLDTIDDKAIIRYARTADMSPGWLVPVHAGYQRIFDLQNEVPGQRCKDYKHTFVEPVVTLGEYVISKRISRMDDALWNLDTDKDKNYFIFRQENNI